MSASKPTLDRAAIGGGARGAGGPGRPPHLYFAVAVQVAATVLMATGGKPALHVIVGGLLIAGLWFGVALARWVVLVFAMVIVIGGSVYGIAMLFTPLGSNRPELVFAWVALRGLQVAALRGAASRRFFGLVCPACRSVEVRSARPAGYGPRHCLDCGHRWARGEQHGPDVAAFD